VGLEECADFESDLDAVAVARAFVRATLMSWEMAALVGDAELLTSELVTNAVLHARTSLRLTIRHDDDGLTVTVSDDNMRLPTVAGAAELATSGRGLQLVERLADAWGVEQTGDGKSVWARIGPAAPESDDDCTDLTDTADIDAVVSAIEQRGVGRAEGEPEPT